MLTSKSVSLHISPMHIPQTTASKNDLGKGSALRDRVLGEATGDLQQQPKIVVHPGELCQVALEIKNWESQPQHFTLKLEGAFPLKWCQLQTDVENAPQFGIDLRKSVAQTSDTSMEAAINSVTLEVAAKKSRHIDLWFLIPDDFFEGQDTLQQNKENKLDFRGCLSIYANQNANQGSSSHPIQESNFELNVRPRSTYTTFLPTVYQEVDYIHRFIKIFEQAFDPVVNSFTSMWAHLDPLTAPQALLPFLAHWVDWSIDVELDLTYQRRLIRRAVEIYRYRGTRKGLRFYLHLYTGLPLDEHVEREEDKAIAITEPFGQGCLFGLAHIGEDAIIGGGKAYHFDVRLRIQPNSPIDEQLIRRIIDREKPAFCSYSLRIETD
ncbi:phage tail protein [Hyella patelloides]|nr:phage tail protein [Hyella patelloides]